MRPQLPTASLGLKFLLIFILQIQYCKPSCTTTIPNCQICASATECSKCNSGYSTLTPSGNTTDCHQCASLYGSTCGRCSQWVAMCTGCITGYYRYFNDCYSCTVTNCIACSISDSICQRCGGSYGVDTGGTSCTLCKASNCVYCPLDTYSCIWCSSGYGVQNSNNTCVQCQVGFCTECNDNAYNCFACQFGYNLITTGSISTCQECASYHMNKCSQCHSLDITKCINCTEISKGADPGGICQPCQDSNCLRCNIDFTVCTLCKDSFGVNNGVCSDCQDTNCLLCASDSSTCTMCKDGFSVSGGSCISCVVFFCTDCQRNVSECDACADNYGVKNSLVCQPCNDPNCIKCSTNYLVCTYCNIAYGVEFSFHTCVQCADLINCVNCSANATICLQCVPRLGPNPVTGICEYCSDKCIDCSPVASICVECQPMYGVNSTNLCQPCVDSNCALCSFDRTVCLNCTVEYGVDSATNQCRTCELVVPNCHQCYTDYNICISCDPGFGLNPSICVTCYSLCLMCSPTNFISCISCQTGRYLLVQATNSCQPCIPNCLDCRNSTTCQICSTGYFVDTAQGCTPCPQYCVVCSMNTSYDLPQCSECVAGGGYQFDHHTPVTCREKCGDSVTTDHPCDNDLGVPYDGCSDDCEIESEFQCNSTDRSICSYTGTLNITVTGIQRERLENKCTITLKLEPPLYVFSLMSEQQLKKVFGMANEQISISSIRYNHLTQELEIVTDFTADFVDADIEITFTPTNGDNPRLFAGQDQVVKVSIVSQPREWFYYREFEFTISRMLVFLCYFLVVLGWLAIIVGLCLRRLAGLQAMFVLQFSCMVVLWMSPYMPMPYEDTYPLKYSCGAIVNLIKAQSIVGNKPPYYEQFGLSSAMVNNFVIWVVAEFVALLLTMITKYRLHLYEKNKNKLAFSSLADETCREVNNENKNNRTNPVQQDKEETIEKAINEFQRVEGHYEMASQFLMYVCMLSLVSYVNCILLSASIHTISTLPTILIICVQALALVFLMLRFFCSPDPFGFFRYSFRHEQLLAEWHLVIEIVCLVITVGLVRVVSLPFLSAVPCVLLIVLVLVRKPYKKGRDNYRAVLNWLAMCSLVGWKTLIFYWPQERQRELVVYLMVLANLVLVAIVLVFSIVFVAYDYWADKHEEEELLKKKSAAQQEQIFYKNTVLNELSKSKINSNIIKNKKAIILNQVVNHSLLEYTNKLVEPKKRQNQEMIYCSAGLAEAQQATQLRLRNIKNQIKMQNRIRFIDKCQQQTKLQEYQLPIINSYSNDLPEIDKEVSKIEVKKKVVDNILTNEKIYVYYKGAVELVEDVKNQALNQNKDEYQRAYDQI